MPDLTHLLNDPTLRSFAELDRAAGVPKGTHFRRFKRLTDRLQEGLHFHCCDSREAPTAFAVLMADGRLYPGTVNAVLMTAEGQAALREDVAQGAG